MADYPLPVPQQIIEADKSFCRQHIRDTYHYVSTSARDSSWLKTQEIRPTTSVSYNVGRHIFPKSLERLPLVHRQSSKGVPAISIRSNWVSFESYLSPHTQNNTPFRSNPYYTLANGNETLTPILSKQPNSCRRRLMDVSPTYGNHVSYVALLAPASKANDIPKLITPIAQGRKSRANGFAIHRTLWGERQRQSMSTSPDRGSTGRSSSRVHVARICELAKLLNH